MLIGSVSSLRARLLSEIVVKQMSEVGFDESHEHKIEAFKQSLEAHATSVLGIPHRPLHPPHCDVMINDHAGALIHAQEGSMDGLVYGFNKESNISIMESPGDREEDEGRLEFIVEDVSRVCLMPHSLHADVDESASGGVERMLADVNRGLSFVFTYAYAQQVCGWCIGCGCVSGEVDVILMECLWESLMACLCRCTEQCWMLSNEPSKPSRACTWRSSWSWYPLMHL